MKITEDLAVSVRPVLGRESDATSGTVAAGDRCWSPGDDAIGAPEFLVQPPIRVCLGGPGPGDDDDDDDESTGGSGGNIDPDDDDEGVDEEEDDDDEEPLQCAPPPG